MMSTQYGLAIDSISPPDSNTNISNKQQGVNMPKSQQLSILDKLKPAVDLLEETVNLGFEVIKSLFDEVLCRNFLRKILIRQLADPIRFIPSSPTKTAYIL